MAASAKFVANEFLSLANAEARQLTNMQLQKLVFLAHGYALGLTGLSMYHNNTHAWQWGPVIPRLYKALQKFGSGRVTGPIAVDDPSESLDETQTVVLKGVLEVYKKFSGAQLSDITHRPGSPWSKTWETDKFGVIPIDDIRDYYKKLVAKN